MHLFRSYHFIACAFLLAPLFRPASFSKPEDGMQVSITHLRSNKGHVLISLFKEGEGFPDKTDKAIRKEKLSIADKQATVRFTGLTSGNYAIAILHDENDDQKMNTNFLGIPKEGYGFSNNAMGTFGPPSFSKASFRYETGVLQVAVKTRY